MARTIYYVTVHDLNSRRALGVKKKVLGQIDAFNKLGLNTSLIYLSKNQVFQDEKVIGSIGNLRNKVVKQFKVTRFLKIIQREVKWEKESLLYVRFMKTNKAVINFLKYINEKRIQIVIEFPSYPYSTEDRGLKAKFYTLLDYFFRAQLKNYTTLTVNYNSLHEIEGIKSIPICNGIMINTPISFPLAKWGVYDNEIRVVAVANISFWHGYDRFIEGLKNYYSTPQEVTVLLDLVGDSKVKEKLQELTSVYSLEKYVSFHGFQSGSRLEEITKNAHLGLGSLGLHRLKLESTSTLKLKEYSLYGLPVIADPKDPDFQKLPFVHHIPYNETPIDILAILEFYRNLISEKKENSFIQNYAAENFSWNTQMQKILGQLN